MLQFNACGIILKPMAMAYNNADPCQVPYGAPMPNFCGYGTGNTTYIRDFNSGRVIATTQTNLYNNNQTTGSLYAVVRPF